MKFSNSIIILLFIEAQIVDFISIIIIFENECFFIVFLSFIFYTNMIKYYSWLK